MSGNNIRVSWRISRLSGSVAAFLWLSMAVHPVNVMGKDESGGVPEYSAAELREELLLCSEKELEQKLGAILARRGRAARVLLDILRLEDPQDRLLVEPISQSLVVIGPDLCTLWSASMSFVDVDSLVQICGRMGSCGILHLIEASVFRERSSRFRSLAERELSMRPQDLAEHRQVLVSLLLAAQDRETREYLASLVSHLPGIEIEEVLAALTHTRGANSGMQMDVVRGWRPGIPESTLSVVVDSLRNDEASERMAALDVLLRAESIPEQIMVMVEQLLESGPREVRAQALAVLETHLSSGKVKDRVVPIAVEMASSREKLGLSMVLSVLADHCVASEDVLNVFCDVLQNRPQHLHFIALKGLERLAKREGLPASVVEVVGRYFMLKGNGERILAVSGAEGLGFLVGGIRAESDRVRLSAAVGLGAVIGTDLGVVEALEQGTRDQNEEVRFRSAFALAARGRVSDTIPRLLVEGLRLTHWPAEVLSILKTRRAWAERGAALFGRLAREERDAGNRIVCIVGSCVLSGQYPGDLETEVRRLLGMPWEESLWTAGAVARLVPSADLDMWGARWADNEGWWMRHWAALVVVAPQISPLFGPENAQTA